MCAITLIDSFKGEGHNLRIHNRLNPLQCAYFIDTKLKKLFDPLENNIDLICERFRSLKLYI